MAMIITAFYASLLATLFLFLSVRVIGWRRQQRIEIGHGEDLQLLRRMRVHANFAEYVPLTLIVMALAENMQAPHAFVHLVGLLLLAGRSLHAYGLSQTPHILRYRVWGMTLTFVALGIGALMCFTLSALFLFV
jgi:uncharacterized protein